jgi:hypothetical protein
MQAIGQSSHSNPVVLRAESVDNFDNNAGVSFCAIKLTILGEKSGSGFGAMTQTRPNTFC